MANFTKDPDALLDYKVDFNDWLGNDQIVSATVFCDATAVDATANAILSGLRVASTNVSASSAVVAWLSAGIVDSEYTVTTRIWTSAGRRQDECFTVTIEEC